MPLGKPMFVGKQRRALLKLNLELAEFGLGEGVFYPGFGLEEADTRKVADLLAVIDRLLGETVPE